MLLGVEEKEIDMEKYTIYCTTVQIRKALELGAPIKAKSIKEAPNSWSNVCIIGGTIFALPPTAEQMIGWLKSQGFKFILSDIKDFDGKCWVTIYNDKEVSHGANIENKELAAIDAALDYLIKKQEVI